MSYNNKRMRQLSPSLANAMQTDVGTFVDPAARRLPYRSGAETTHVVAKLSAKTARDLPKVW